MQRFLTMPSGTGLLTPCLWFLRFFLWWQGLLFFLSGKHVKWNDALWCKCSVLCKNIMCVYLLQGDSLYMGVSAGAVCSFLRLLLLQHHAVSSTNTPPLLGCSHFTNGLQIYLQQGVSPRVYGWQVISKNCQIFKLYICSFFVDILSYFFLWLIWILQLEGDDRSDEEEEDSDSPKETKRKLSHMNGDGARGRPNGHWHKENDTGKHGHIQPEFQLFKLLHVKGIQLRRKHYF